MKNIIEDKREIERIEIFTQDARDMVSYSTRDTPAIKIIPYYESVEMAGVIWFAIEREGEVIARINGKYVQVIEYND